MNQHVRLDFCNICRRRLGSSALGRIGSRSALLRVQGLNDVLHLRHLIIELRHPRLGFLQALIHGLNLAGHFVETVLALGQIFGVRLLKVGNGRLHRVHIVAGLFDKRLQDGRLGVDGLLHVLHGLLERVQLLHHADRFLAHPKGGLRRVRAKG